MKNTVFKKFNKLLRGAGPIMAIILLSIFLSFVSPVFFTLGNIINITKQAASLGVLSLAMMIAILTGGIDLSVGSLMALSTIIMGVSIKAGVPPILSLVICIVSGIALGCFNGLLLTKLRLPHPFISTIGTQKIFRGMCLIITMGTPISSLGKEVIWAGSASIGIIPVSIILLLVIYIMFSIFLNKTVIGRHIYALGGNPVNAQLSGINKDNVLIITYSVSGLMCAIAGIIFVGRVDSVSPLTGYAWETDAIAAVIVGGASFFGGRGTVLGTLSGVILIAVLRNGLNLLSITPDAQEIILGGIIIIAVFIDVVRNGEFTEIIKKFKQRLNLPKKQEI